MSCCEPGAPEGATSAVIGRLQFAGDGICNDQRPLTFKYGECCMPVGPSDSRWTAAKHDGMMELLREVDAHSTIDSTCCNMPDPFKSKAELDAEWMPKFNALLAKHGLVGQLHAYWSYNGQTSQPEMQMLIYRLDDPAAQAERIKLGEMCEKMAASSTTAPGQIEMK